MLDYFLDLDTRLLIQARSSMSDDATIWIILLGEFIVVWYMLCIIGLWLYGGLRNSDQIKKYALNIAVLIVLVFGIYSILNFGIPQWRASPQDVIGSVNALIPHPLDNSFPSGHALFWGAGLVGIWFFWRSYTLLLLSIIIGFISNAARVFGAVHYPGDTLFGCIIGIIGGLLFLSLSKKITHYLFPYAKKIAGFFGL